MFSEIEISSPKRDVKAQTGWEGFYPYYAGFPETFASKLLKSIPLKPDAVIFDPWNGSGTSTFVAAQLGFHALGYDINPVMVIVARSRLLPPTESSSLLPIAEEIVRVSADTHTNTDSDDPLRTWLTPAAARSVRILEQNIRKILIGDSPTTEKLDRFNSLSCISATFYVALFSVCRELTASFGSSNPTWLRKPKTNRERLYFPPTYIRMRFLRTVEKMASALMERSGANFEHGNAVVKLEDTTISGPHEKADLILTSPPYCTRIDYTAATRIELALLSDLLNIDALDLSRRMTGTTRVPQREIVPRIEWGPSCNRFLKKLYGHPSKASQGYYYLTHLDYFDKMYSSLERLTGALRHEGAAILIAQDSFYKDLHNDLPAILSEMASSHGLGLRRRVDFSTRVSMARINTRSKVYGHPGEATEAVLCFQKDK